MPRQADHHDVDQSQHQQPRRLGRCVSIELIHDEHSKCDDGGRINPQLHLEQTYNERQLDHAVTQQVDGGEVLRADRQVPSPEHQMGGDKVVRIFGEFILCDRGHDSERPLRCYEVCGGAPDDLDQCEDAFEQQAELEYEMDVFLLK